MIIKKVETTLSDAYFMMNGIKMDLEDIEHNIRYLNRQKDDKSCKEISRKLTENVFDISTFINLVYMVNYDISDTNVELGRGYQDENELIRQITYMRKRSALLFYLNCNNDRIKKLVNKSKLEKQDYYEITERLYISVDILSFLVKLIKKDIFAEL